MNKYIADLQQIQPVLPKCGGHHSCAFSHGRRPPYLLLIALATYLCSSDCSPRGWHDPTLKCAPSASRGVTTWVRKVDPPPSPSRFHFLFFTHCANPLYSY